MVLHAFSSNKVCRYRGGKAMKENTFLLSAVLAGIDTNCNRMGINNILNCVLTYYI